jgi:hypothetical protein
VAIHVPLQLTLKREISAQCPVSRRAVWREAMAAWRLDGEVKWAREEKHSHQVKAYYVRIGVLGDAGAA